MSPRQAQSLLRRAVRALRAKPSAPREGTEQLREAAAAAPRAPNAAPTVRARAGGESRLRGMRIQRIRGRDMVDALERAARELGPDALVLSREPAPGGGVTVAFGVPGTQSAPAPLDPGLRDVQRLLQRAGASAEFLERVSRAVVQSGA